MINRTLLGCCFLLLAACMHRSLPPSCTASCDSRLVACTQVCHNNCATCSATAKKAALRSYRYYKHEKYVQGKIVALQLNSFRDPLQCRKITCNCRADYQLCIQSCGGAISKGLKHTPLCS